MLRRIFAKAVHPVNDVDSGIIGKNYLAENLLLENTANTLDPEIQDGISDEDLVLEINDANDLILLGFSISDF